MTSSFKSEMEEELFRNGGLWPEQNKLFDTTTMTKVRILDSQSIGFSDFVQEKTHVSQKSPAQLRESMENFHKKSQSVRNNGTYLLGDLANMFQTPLPL